MREEGRAARAVERLRLALLAVGIGAAAIVVLGGMLGKSWAWTGSREGAWYGWTDGVKPWALWAFVVGLVVIALLLIGRSRGDGLWLVAGAGAFVLWHAGNEAAAYHKRLEGGMFTMYEQHTVSFGLRVVPTAGTVAAIAVGALALLTLGMMVTGRAAPSAGV